MICLPSSFSKARIEIESVWIISGKDSRCQSARSQEKYFEDNKTSSILSSLVVKVVDDGNDEELNIKYIFTLVYRQ